MLRISASSTWKDEDAKRNIIENCFQKHDLSSNLLSESFERELSK